MGESHPRGWRATSGLGACEVSDSLIDLEAERILVGAVMVRPALIDSTQDIVRPMHFSLPLHRWAYEAVASLVAEASEVSPVTVRREIEKGRELSAEDKAALYGLIDGLPRMEHANEWARKVRESARRRELIANARAWVDLLAGDTEGTDEILGRIGLVSARLLESGDGTHIHQLPDMLKASVDVLERFAATPDGLTGIPTSLTSLDHLIGGWQPGSLYIVAARPARGKSVFCAQAVIHAAQAGKTVLSFSLEMPPQQVAQRMLLGEARVNRWELRTHHKADAAWDRIGKAVGRLSGLPVFLDDRPSPTLAQIAATARRVKASNGLGLLVVDYLQRCTVDHKIDRWKAIGELVRGLKGLAMSLDVPVIVAAQVNRDGDSAKPTLAMLREAGDIEQEADLVAFFHPAEPGAMDRDDAPMDMLIEKNRHGATSSIPLTLERTYTRFTERFDGEITEIR